jgi:hypothetical protein
MVGQITEPAPGLGQGIGEECAVGSAEERAKRAYTQLLASHVSAMVRPILICYWHSTDVPSSP